ncbi:hypothetical protein T10_11214 [Trichinella papuae]|uniref:Uncharacterized protein n=1 Tax=Trichinella papuae TaxID=268474 RepID=A0A0V1M1V2_9BILA|nr:hypothetical protein T10_11214 [Trichinella papuae]
MTNDGGETWLVIGVRFWFEIGLASNQMSTSKRVGGRNVHSDGDGPDENNKAEADPPTVTANPLQREW